MSESRTVARVVTIAAFVTLIGIGVATAQPPAPKAEAVDRWEAFRFLVGTWVADSSADPRQGSGEFTFSMYLQDNILVRENHTVIAATSDKPAVTHDDLMVIYHDQQQTLASYWDNEGHAISYTTSFNVAKDTLTFVSDIVTGVPRFRLMYIKLADGGLKITFDFAPPGQPDAFAPYLQGTAHKKPTK